MIQEAVLDTREGDRYVGFLVEEEEWLNRTFKWRVIDRLTGTKTEGPIPAGSDEQIRAFFEATWKQFDAGICPPPQSPALTSEYADHPNYGRF